MPEARWVLFRGPGGGDVVRKEINACFKNDKRGRAQLLDLMERVRDGRTLGREVEGLGGGLLEAKLSYRGQEFRLFYSRAQQGLLFVALHMINKKVPRASDAIKLARQRLADWQRRSE